MQKHEKAIAGHTLLAGNHLLGCLLMLKEIDRKARGATDSKEQFWLQMVHKDHEGRPHTLTIDSEIDDSVILGSPYRPRRTRRRPRQNVSHNA